MHQNHIPHTSCAEEDKYGKPPEHSRIDELEEGSKYTHGEAGRIAEVELVEMVKVGCHASG